MNTTIGGTDEAGKLKTVSDSLFEIWSELEEAWLALDRDESLTAKQRDDQRAKINAQIAELKLMEAQLSLDRIRALDQSGELDGLISALQSSVADTKTEVDRMRKATKVAQRVSKVLQAATKAIGFLAKIAARV